MTEYTLQKGSHLTLIANKDLRVRVKEFGGIMTIEAFDLIETKRMAAAVLLAEADALERINLD